MTETSTPGPQLEPGASVPGIAVFAGATLASVILDRLFALGLTVLMSAVFGATRQLDDYLLSVVGPVLIATLVSDVMYSLLLPEFMTAQGDLQRETWTMIAWASAVLATVTIAYGLLWTLGVLLFGGGSSRLLELGAVASPLILFSGVSAGAGTALIAHRRYYTSSARLPVGSLVTLAVFAVWSRVSVSVTVLAASLVIGWVVSAALALVTLATVVGPPVVEASPAAASRLFRRLRGRSFAQVVSGALAQAPAPIERLIAFPLGAGVLSSLNYGRVLVSPPLYIAQSVATASYPRFVALKSTEREQRLKALGRSIGMIFFLVLPLTILVGGLAYPLVQVVYHHGAFDQQSVTRTTVAATILAAALIPIAIGGVLVRFLYAEEASQQVARTSLLALVGYIALALVLGLSSGYVGLAVASVGFYTILAVAQLILVARRSPIGLRFLPYGTLVRTLVAGGVTAAGMTAVQIVGGPTPGKLVSLGIVVGASMVGLLLYIVVSLLLKIEELQLVLGLMRRAAAAAAGRGASRAATSEPAQH